MNYLLVILLLVSPLSFSAVFKQVSKDGNITYSDVPMKNAEELNLPDASTIKVTPPAPIAVSGEASAGAASVTVDSEKKYKPYTSFLITSPKNLETFHNQRNILIEAKSDPELQTGDQVQLFLDGKPSGNPAPTSSQVLQILDRGTHTVSAAILNSSQQVVSQSNAITIYIQLTSVNNRAGNL
jgi:hypothetical protein